MSQGETSCYGQHESPDSPDAMRQGMSSPDSDSSPSSTLVDEEFLKHYRVEEILTSRQTVYDYNGYNNYGDMCQPSAAAAGSSPMGDYQYNADVKMGIEELCPVCGDKVSGYHYGLQTCESCKGFFKRTVQNKKVYSCVDNRNCLIDKTQRKRCPYCRFQKCLSVGMKLEAVRADRMRGGRNKFGPMYKRDRALKQQVVRQRQQMLAQMTYQMQINSMNNPGMGGGMPPSPNMGVMPNMDGMGPDAGPPDIKPNVAMLNMPPPHASNGGSHGPMGPTNMIGPPPHPMQHMLPMNSPENPSTSAPSGASAHSSHQGHYLPPQSYPSGIPTMNAISSMPMPMPSHMPAPPSHHHHHPYHHHHHHQHQPPLGGPGPPNLMPLNPVLPPPHTQSPPNQPAIPPLFRDLQKNEPDEREIQEKFNSVMEMLLQQQQTLLVSQQQDMNDSMMAQPSEHALQDLPRSTLQLLIKLCDQALFLLVEWARGGHFFRDFKVEDQMKLLQNCWSELLILDFIYKQTNHHKFDELLLMSGHSVSTGVLSKIGLGDVQGRLDDLVKKFRDLKLDHNEFVCLKFLILLNPDAPGVMNRQLVEHSQEKVNSALLEYCSSFYPNIQDKFGQLLVRLPEIRLISLHAEDYLYFRHLNGDIPENTLLMEMLHSKRK